ncbi:MAG: hypothetical protein ACI3XG_08740, partial [Faecousia sp.]
MNRKGFVGTILAAILAVVLAVTLAVCYFTLKYYVVVDWQLFPRNQEQLDLRDRSITPQTYDTLVWKLPGTQILWSVPFQDSCYDFSTQEITVDHLSQDDLDTLVYFPMLEAVNAQNCTDYDVLKLLYEQRPDLEVRYSIPIGGRSYGPDTQTVTLETLTQEDMQRLDFLPRLTLVDGTACREFTRLRELEQTHPQWKVVYMTSIAGTEFTPSTTELVLTGAAYEDLSIGLAGMPALRELTIHSPKATGEELARLREEYPNVDIHWDIEVFGQTFPDDATEVDISNQRIDSIEQAKEIASKFPNLTKLIVDSTGIDNDEMAVYRDEVRSQYKVVWTVIFTEKCKARTDETWFMPIHQGEYYFEEKNVYNLRFCEDMVCIDIGHSTVKTVDFASYMPHLKYLILAWTCVEDITPLSNCKELVYLELDHCVIHDYTPLQGCTALEDLNINDNDWPVSIEPLLSMTWLKNLWVPTRSYS